MSATGEGTGRGAASPADDDAGADDTPSTWTADAPEERLDVAAARLAGLSRARVQQLAAEGRVYVDGVAAAGKTKVRAGQTIAVDAPAPALPALVPEPVAFDVVYEDAHLAVIDKPAGLVVHPAAGHPTGTLVHGLLWRWGPGFAPGDTAEGINGVLRPGIVHRIDRDTSGLLVVSRGDRAHRGLQAQFAAHTIERRYLAVVYGTPEPRDGRIETPHRRHPHFRMRYTGRHGGERTAVTRFSVQAAAAGLALVACELETGRTHQIRMHLSERGHPLVGDELYGGLNAWRGQPDAGLRKLLRDTTRHALHAAVLGFVHPVTGERLCFSSPVPPDMQRLIDAVRAAGG